MDSHSLFIEGPVVNAHTPPAVLFGDKQDRRAVGTRTGPNETLSKEVFNLLLHLVLLSWPKSVRWLTRGFRALLCANLMNYVPFWGTSLRQCVREYILELIDEFLPFPRTPRPTLDRISSSRSSTLRNRFFGPVFFIRSRFFPSVSPMDSDFTAALTVLFSCPQTTAKKTGVFFFTSFFNYLTDIICRSQDNRDDRSVVVFFAVLVLSFPILPFRVSFLSSLSFFSPVRSFLPFVSFSLLLLPVSLPDFTPVLPKPPAPRTVSSRPCTSSTGGVSIFS